MDSVAIRQITDPEALAKASKHAGWCTKYEQTAKRYLYNGYCYTITKDKGRNRPSWLLFSHSDGYQWELKAKANRPVKPAEFIKRFPSTKDTLKRLLPDRAFAPARDFDAVRLYPGENLDQFDHIRTDEEIKAIVQACIEALKESND